MNSSPVRRSLAALAALGLLVVVASALRAQAPGGQEVVPTPLFGETVEVRVINVEVVVTVRRSRSSTSPRCGVAMPSKGPRTSR